MKNMKTIQALMLLTPLGGFATAATITQTETLSAYLAGNPAALTFATFDSNLGTLTGVTVGFSFVKSGGSLAVDNDGTIGGSVLFRHDLEAYITSETVNIGSSSLINTALARSSASFTVGANDGDSDLTFDVGTSDYHLYNAVTKSTTFATENIDTAYWANYTGTGTENYEIAFETIQSYSASGVGGLQTIGLAASVAPSVTVTYNYTPTVIPEPASWLMVCAGIGGFLFQRRRS